MQQHAITQINTIESSSEELHFEVVSVKCIKLGEFVRKIGKDGKMQTKTYQRGEFDRATKTYSLTDCANINRVVSVKASAKLAVGFTY